GAAQAATAEAVKYQAGVRSQDAIGHRHKAAASQQLRLTTLAKITSVTRKAERSGCEPGAF
ncbi:hypothetical protein, partial [Lysobacter sp. 22409]|uniref:hypothetical protein n=1 Tax=Lysobacter sp. 22409 TaxID=3453917 RepID=UPI003F830D1E